MPPRDDAHTSYAGFSWTYLARSKRTSECAHQVFPKDNDGPYRRTTRPSSCAANVFVTTTSCMAGMVAPAATCGNRVARPPGVAKSAGLVHKRIVPAPDESIRIGVSSCLLGREVRYDGGHKYDRFRRRHAGPARHVRSRMPRIRDRSRRPRETLRLVRVGDSVRLVGNNTGTDHTAEMTKYASKASRAREARALRVRAQEELSELRHGAREGLYAARHGLPRPALEWFADALLRTHRLLPVEEEGRLNDPRLRESFIERVFRVPSRCRSCFASVGPSADLVRFQEHEKLLLMAHEPAKQRELGRLVAAAKQMARTELRSCVYPGLHARDRKASPAKAPM